MIRLIALGLLLLWSAGPRPAFAQAQGNGSTANASAGQTAAPRPTPTASVQTQLAASELSRIDQEIAALSAELNVLIQIEAMRPQIAQLRASAINICQTPPAQRTQFAAQLQDAIAGLRRASASVSTIFPWERNQYELEPLCAANRLQPSLQELEGALGASARRTEIESKVRDLTTRRQDVIQEMAQSVAGTQVAGDIKLMMLIIFGVGALILLGLKLFNDDIQAELVGSGQIVQFVTILILLGVILALGLAQRLQAETLGTLLGGLAGYVLSQGVGRQERRQVAKEIIAATAVGGVT